MPAQIETFSIQTTLGPLHCAVGPAGVLVVDLPPTAEMAGFLAETARRSHGAPTRAVDATQNPAGRQLLAYLAGQADALTMAADLDGLAPFSQKVLMAIRAIPPGQTWTYGQTAAAVGSPKAARAVGQALHRNPAALFCPCHRVVGANGGLTGFASGLEVKRALLALEAGGPPLL